MQKNKKISKPHTIIYLTADKTIFKIIKLKSKPGI